MKRVVLYVEGGGDSADQKAQLRTGFDGLFLNLKELARGNGVSFRIVCAGDRNNAHKAFLNAQDKSSDVAFLLVDSEEGLPGAAKTSAGNRTAFLRKRDGWALSEDDEDRVHLMVCCMETWIVSDPETLGQFYGNGFNKGVLPARQNLEEESKKDVQDKLRRATSGSNKGEYQKLRHASQILPKLKSQTISARCQHFELIVSALGKALSQSAA